MSPPRFPLAMVRAVQAQVATANTELTRSLSANDASGVRAALEAGAEALRWGLSPSGKRKSTVLHAAIERDAPDLLRVFLDSGVDANATDGRGYTPLMHAAQHDRAWAVSALLDAGAVHVAPQDKGTALELALLLGSDATVEALLAHPRHPPDLRGAYGVSCMFKAHTARSIKALVASGADPHGVSRNGDVAFTAFDWLLHQSSPEDSSTALIVDPVDALQVFIDFGCAVSSETLRHAARRALPRCLKALDAQGLDWSFQPDDADACSTLDLLIKASPELGAHWADVLRARSEARRLTEDLVQPVKSSVRARV